MTQIVRKAVFPVGGLGTRFLPATKAMPKEMLPIVDKPLIQHAVEEAAAAGIETFIFVTGKGEAVLKEHFGGNPALMRVLEARGKESELAAVRDILPASSHIAYVRQSEPLGLGHAVGCARELIGDEPFAVILPDDLVLADIPCLQQMVSAWQTVGGNLVGVMDVPRDRTDRYGILDVGEDDAQPGGLAEVKGLVEKPAPADAPSTLSIIGRYILQPEIFAELDRGNAGAGGEIQLTDAMARLIGKAPFHGFRFAGDRFDCGEKLGFIAATVAYALRRDDLEIPVRAALEGLLTRKGNE